MRIVMLLGSSTGGIGTHVAELSAHLHERGHEVHVVTNDLTADSFDFGDSPVHREWPHVQVGADAWARLRATRGLLAAADVVHAHGNQAGLVALAARRSGTGAFPPVAVSWHNAVLPTARARAMQLRSLALVCRRSQLVTGASSDLVAQAHSLGARWAELAPVSAPSVATLLGRGTDRLDARRAAGARLLGGLRIPASQPLVVTVSRIAPQKDLMTAVRAAASLDTEVTWVVVGGGDDGLLARLERESERIGSPLRFVGPRADVAEWLTSASVFALPSIWEARSLAVQEAMASGTPVVATDTGGLPDLVSGVGTLVPVGDPQALAHGIRRALRDPQQWARESRAGRQRAATWPSGAEVAQMWLGWYARLRR